MSSYCSILSQYPQCLINYRANFLSSKVMRSYKKVVSPFCPIPIRPIRRNKLNCTSHHVWWFKRQGETIWGQVTGSIHMSIEPISLLGLSVWTGLDKRHDAYKFLQQTCVKGILDSSIKSFFIFAWKLIHKYFQSSHRIIIGHRTSPERPKFCETSIVRKCLTNSSRQGYAREETLSVKFIFLNLRTTCYIS